LILVSHLLPYPVIASKMNFFKLNGNITTVNFMFGVFRVVGVTKGIAVTCGAVRIQESIWNVNGFEFWFTELHLRLYSL
jgi:hypothetical protein